MPHRACGKLPPFAIKDTTGAYSAAHNSPSQIGSQEGNMRAKAETAAVITLTLLTFAYLGAVSIGLVSVSVG